MSRHYNFRPSHVKLAIRTAMEITKEEKENKEKTEKKLDKK